MKDSDSPPPFLLPYMLGPVHRSIWANWTYWTYSWPCVCAARRVCITSSLQQNRPLSRMQEPEMKAWPGIQTLWSTQPPPPSLSILNPPPTPSILLLPSPPPAAPPQLAVEDGFSESSWDQDQRQITADVYAKCNMETPQLCPHYWFFSLLLLTPSLSPHFPASFFIEAQYYAVWNLKKKGPRTLLQMKQKRKEVGGGDLAVPSYACLHLESILWCK